MSQIMQAVTETRKIAHRDAVRFAMRGACVDRCIPNLIDALSNGGRTNAALALGYAMDSSAHSDAEGGYRIDMHGLPAAADMDGEAPTGTYAVLPRVGDANRAGGEISGWLKRSRIDGGWTSKVEGEPRTFDDPCDAAADFMRRAQPIFADDVLDSEATRRITVADRNLAADIHRAVEIAEAAHEANEPTKPKF